MGTSGGGNDIRALVIDEVGDPFEIRWRIDFGNDNSVQIRRIGLQPINYWVKQDR